MITLAVADLMTAEVPSAPTYYRIPAFLREAGLRCLLPGGLENGTDGSIQVAIGAIGAASAPPPLPVGDQVRPLRRRLDPPATRTCHIVTAVAARLPFYQRPSRG